MREKNKIKIVLSLLIAVSFMLTSISVIGSNIPTEEVEASALRAGIKPIAKVDVTIDSLDAGSIIPLAPWSVGVTAISVNGIDRDNSAVIASGTYPLDVTVCKLQADPLPATVKKFIEIFKKVVIPGTPDNMVDLYCEDFEDPCEIALNWSTIDMPVWGYNGALDTWTWSAKRYASPSHSMHSTSFDQYLPNQWDILELGFNGAGIDVSAYDSINITWKQFVDGDFQGTTLQDYGYFEYSFDDAIWTQAGINYYDSNGTWQTIVLNIPVTGNTMYFRWTWISDPIFCYEGWYIDDVCLVGIIGGTPGTTTWEFVMDSYSYPQVIEGMCETYVFNESWIATVGEYRICAWLQALDPEHFSLTEYDNPYCIYITIGNHLELALDCTSTVITPPSPAFEGDDITETIDVSNIGTLDATNVQVQMTVNRGSLVTEFYEGFEGLTNQPDGTIKSWENPGDEFITEWVKNWQGNTRSWAHFTTYDATEGVQSLANFKEVGAQPWGFVTSASTSEYTRGPFKFKKGDKDMGITATFDYKTNLGTGERFLAGIWDWTLGSGQFWYITPFGPVYNDWTTVTIDLSSIIGAIGVAGDDYTMGFYMYKDTNNAGDPACPWNGEWSGYMVDNIYLTSLVAEPEVIYQQTNVIPFLNITGPSQTVTTEFNWLDAGVGRYVFTTEILTADEDDSNNLCVTPYNIINIIKEAEDMVCVDYTGPGLGHWVEEACCGGYFWVGDPVTTQYGINWSDALFLRNATGGLTFDLSAEPQVCIEFDTWFQIDYTDGVANDAGYLQVSMDGGLTWSNAATFFGNSSDLGWGADSFGWFHVSVCDGVSSTMQFRFLFESNATLVNRGWIIDNIELNDGVTPIFGPDPALNFNNFYRHEKQYGCWWQQPWIYQYFVHDMGYLPYYGAPYLADGANDPSWGVYDQGIINANPGYPARPWMGAAPDNLDTALIWTLDVPQAFFGWFETTTYYDTDANDHGYIEVFNGTGWDIVSDDQGSYNDDAYGGTLSLKTVIANDLDYWSGKSIDLTGYMDQDQMQIRFRYTSDAANLHRYMGFGMLGGITFYGMEDLNPPVTTLQMSGTFNEEFHYYTSAVKMKLTATDDITGVAHTYYKLDGVTHEYTGLVTINTDGDHTFCYWSVDNQGNVEAEKCVPSFRIDLTGPTVTITGPTAGLYLFGNLILPLSSGKIIFLFGGIPVTATVTADDAPIQVVRFYLDDVLLAEDSTAPYAATLSAKHSGAAVIKVTAVDVLGHEGSATLNIDNYIKLF